jgi:polysaccharide deacetylase family protein (PEP-CTERM system associated)
MLRNALTIDVEDYFHVSAFAKAIKPEDWEHYESRIERNTHRVLELLDEHRCKATFFVLGWVAERFPQLPREIAERGHEVACHGYTHQLIYDQTPEIFRQDTLRAKTLLEDIVQTPVRGYRAASFSITNRSEWALDILAETGFRYDSSVFPTRHDRYGLPGANAVPHRIATHSGQDLIEFPLSTVCLFGYRLPVAGGGYFRLYPYVLTRAAFRRINHKKQQPFVFYLHPWEIDPDQPRLNGTALSRFRHYNNLARCETRLVRLLDDFRFGTMQSVLDELDL